MFLSRDTTCFEKECWRCMGKLFSLFTRLAVIGWIF